MKYITQALIIIGSLILMFALYGLSSHSKSGQFVGLDENAVWIDLLIGMFLLVAGLAVMLCGMARDRVVEKREHQDAEAGDGPPPVTETPLCPSCLAPAAANQHFCMKCWTPLTSHAEIDPLGQVYATGDMYWKLTRGPSKPIAMIGFLLIFAPLIIVQLFWAVITIIGVLRQRGHFSLMNYFTTLDGAMMLLCGMFFLTILFVQCAVLVRVIKNYRHPDWRERLRCEVRPDKEYESAVGESGDQPQSQFNSAEIRENRDR